MSSQGCAIKKTHQICKMKTERVIKGVSRDDKEEGKNHTRAPVKQPTVKDDRMYK